MGKWNILSEPTETRSFNIGLHIHVLEDLCINDNQGYQNYSLMVRIKWRGPRKQFRKSFNSPKECTRMQLVKPDGTVEWNEGFNHVCKMMMEKMGSFRSWDIQLAVHGSDLNSNDKASNLAKVILDVAQFIPSNSNSSKKTISIPIKCNVKDSTIEAALKVSFKFHELGTNDEPTKSPVRAQLLPTLSCIGFNPQQVHRPEHIKPSIKKVSSQKIQSQSLKGKNAISHVDVDPSNYRYSPNSSKDSFTCSSSEEENRIVYKNLPELNFLAETSTSENDEKKSLTLSPVQTISEKTTRHPSLIRLTSWKKGKLSFKVSHPKGTPLLNKASQEGGDDIHDDRRHQLSTSHLPIQPKEELEQTQHGFEDEDHFAVGRWEKKRFTSRDGKMELCAQVFLASIDQRSEEAAGAGACSVLVAVIADWLHKNPKNLPIKCQFDTLIQKGSLEWRKLCENKSNKDEFSDHHFDIETVLQAGVSRLSILSERSYVGFFIPENVPECCEFLQAAMSFDRMWEELIASPSEEAIYIVSWNDHFFVLKVETEEIFIIDTLGDRLSEGCIQAYILKFDKETEIRRSNMEDQIDSKQRPQQHGDADHGISASELPPESSAEVIRKGKSSCKEFIKGFLAALQLRDLEQDVERGHTGKASLHQRLQIEFHYTVIQEETAQTVKENKISTS
ncbi:uncharacterized protein LOC18423680 [Amborella trichopoda]|uniref:C2 NT-type domain-containing protein n=1 Tax=Amborella trichopoda TaxID=13333 RepID=W1NJ13_AMBTC|nr:uncharacterized protein LOC18423680 [Amborella trichopoda]ERM95757.1 hypothetical protein AMTR_s00023p00248410 [Amborella trichopoda]|eukprot:XP_006828341.3 uncharacterized protein LOC18423680 [Amborella trichopoda]